MNVEPNDEHADEHTVSEEDKRIVAELIANMPASVSTNYSTGEVVKIYRDGRVVKSTIEPIQPEVNVKGGDIDGVGKISFKIDLDI